MNKPNQPHEAAAHHEKAVADALAATHDSKVLMEGTGAQRVVRFTINGQVKSLNLPVSGAELYRVAGSPQKLTVGGHVVANNTETLDLADDAEVTAAY
jgi:hypothetical protein